MGIHVTVGVHEAVVADLHKSRGQDVLQKTPDEFHDIENHGSVTTAALFAVAEGDSAVFHFENAVVGYGNLEDLGCQVFECGGAVADGLAVNVFGVMGTACGIGVLAARLLSGASDYGNTKRLQPKLPLTLG